MLWAKGFLLVRGQGTKHRIRVSIVAERLIRIFDPLPTSLVVKKGTGLGLSLVYAIYTGDALVLKIVYNV